MYLGIVLLLKWMWTDDGLLGCVFVAVISTIPDLIFIDSFMNPWTSVEDCPGRSIGSSENRVVVDANGNCSCGFEFLSPAIVVIVGGGGRALGRDLNKVVSWLWS